MTKVTKRTKVTINSTNDVEAMFFNENQSAEFRFMRGNASVLKVHTELFNIDQLRRYALLYCMHEMVAAYADKPDATAQEQYEAAFEAWDKLAWA